MTDKKREPTPHHQSVDGILLQLQERAKELGCLYKIEEALSSHDESLETICRKIIEAIPPGWQYPSVCVAKIRVDDKTFTSPNFVETAWVQTADITIGNSKIGSVRVYYTEECPQWDDGPFLKEEARLIKTIAERLGHWILHQKMHNVIKQWEDSQIDTETSGKGEWRIVLQMLKQTDPNLYDSVSRKMLNHLCWSGVPEADELLQSYIPDPRETHEESAENWNRPDRRQATGFSSEISKAVFSVANKNLPDEGILRLVEKWIQEDKLSFLAQVVNRNLSLADVADAIRRYHHIAENQPEIQSPNKRGIEVSLIRRFLSDHLEYINVAKNFIELRDFYQLLNHVIYSTESHGKLGGKSAGLYIAAQILKKESATNDVLGDVRIPKTYHITSDVLLHFMHYNNFDEVVEQKYKPINQVRFEYPHIVQTFKNARFPGDIEKGLSVALDEFGDRPLIVRSSSLLEDRVGAAFSGKYKSLFLANQGSKQLRLEALMDAIAEVYASTFSPDPIEYRAERGLLDFGEEMGIMIQEVVGTRVGKYFLPSFAGVAFSNNEFRWSPRIRREDGLIRLVPGLGTRAVDRLSDDYPVLIAPGQPGLRVNTSPDEVARYSPKMIDVIDLDTNAFETIELSSFLKVAGDSVPGIEHMVSIYEDGHFRIGSGMGVDFDRDNIVVTFEGLISRMPFVKQMKAILDTLEDKLGMPVDIEFASDGRQFYLLQCRAQSYSQTSAPAPIPKGISPDKIVFTANKYVSNGRVPDITHIVYVDPESYTDIEDRSRMLKVGQAVSKLNKLLPKRQFVLLGPGRWGSRGDIKLGVSVTYSDINNTAALIEVARQKGNYVPDLSFGTHFFQDLVEANIRYLPLYPDEPGILFNEGFLKNSPNILSDLVPEYSSLSDVIRLVDVPRTTGGQVLRILMNADLEEAMGVLAPPTGEVEEVVQKPVEERGADEHFWQWRMQMVERIASELDPERFGVENMYIFGSTKNATAGPGSDIDLLIHFRGTTRQREVLTSWLDGWSLCLAEMNFNLTGYRTDGLLDAHIITDEDIEKGSSWAAKINAVTDPARPLPLRKKTAAKTP